MNNENIIQSIVSLTKRTIDLMVNDDKLDGVLFKPKSSESLKDFNELTNEIIASKLKKKFKL
jgi:hypothetical protein